MKVYLVQWLRDRSGATAIEYSLIAAGIAVTIATAVYLLGDDLVGLYQDVAAIFTT